MPLPTINVKDIPFASVITPADDWFFLHNDNADDLRRMTVQALLNLVPEPPAASLYIGEPITDGVANYILYVDPSGNLGQNSNFQWDEGVKVFTVSGSIAGDTLNLASLVGLSGDITVVGTNIGGDIGPMNIYEDGTKIYIASKDFNVPTGKSYRLNDIPITFEQSGFIGLGNDSQFYIGGANSTPYFQGRNTFLAGGTTYVPATFKGITSQTSNLVEFQDASGTVGLFIPVPGAGGVIAAIGLGTPGSGAGIRLLGGSGVQLYDSFNAVLNVSLNAPCYMVNAYAQRLLSLGKNLTNAGANNIFAVAVGTLSSSSGQLTCRIHAANATDVQCRTQIIRWEAVNKGGVFTTNVTIVSEGVAASTGTLTGAWSITTATNQITLVCTPNSSLSSLTALSITYTVDSIPAGSTL